MQETMKKEQEEKEHKKKEKAKAHLYTIIKVARDEDIAGQIGKDIYFDLVDHDKEEVAKEFNIPVQFLRFWLWAKRENRTYRPYRLLTPMEEAESETVFDINVRPIDKKLTFRAIELEDGDIICFQKAHAKEHVRYPDVPSYLEYVHNRQVVHFRSLHKPKGDEFCLEMSRLYKYDDVVERVAQQLGLDDPSIIRLTPHNCYSQQPKPQPVKYRGVEHLSEMLVHCDQTWDILYYEVLDIPLPELQGLKTLKVAFHHATKDDESI